MPAEQSLVGTFGIPHDRDALYKIADANPGATGNRLAELYESATGRPIGILVVRKIMSERDDEPNLERRAKIERAVRELKEAKRQAAMNGDSSPINGTRSIKPGKPKAAAINILPREAERSVDPPKPSSTPRNMVPSLTPDSDSGSLSSPLAIAGAILAVVSALEGLGAAESSRVLDIAESLLDLEARDERPAPRSPPDPLALRREPRRVQRRDRPPLHGQDRP